MILLDLFRKIFPFAGTNLRLIKNRYRKNFSDKKRRKFVEKEFKKSIGYDLNWNSLQTYNEKMQREKLYNLYPEKIRCSDKLAVREFVKEKIGEEYLIRILGVWDSFDDIDFSILPDKFVLKTNNASQTNEFIRNKDDINIQFLKKKFDKWMKFNYAYKHFEMQYENIKPKIYAEEFLNFKDNIEDYKFLCFNGEPKFCWIDIDRFNNHKRNVYDLNWNLQDWNQYTYGNYDKKIERPKNFEGMVKIAKKLSEGFKHVRVDLYNIDGKIYFGEMTFTNGAGLEIILPEYYNKVLGDFWDIDDKISSGK
ncbi:MAG: ATP-grasp fold amidoligase family protein [Peptoniphilaceae bacterium]|nr:ATP-grasp fold amidoligase family protein [Peptoniphilaceae bacterium]MDY6018294.1 ATP-grasp fold amidoligase family protein [Anaerococcus sp.]